MQRWFTKIYVHLHHLPFNARYISPFIRVIWEEAINRLDVVQENILLWLVAAHRTTADACVCVRIDACGVCVTQCKRGNRYANNGAKRTRCLAFSEVHSSGRVRKWAWLHAVEEKDEANFMASILPRISAITDFWPAVRLFTRCRGVNGILCTRNVIISQLVTFQWEKQSANKLIPKCEWNLAHFWETLSR